MLVLVLEFSEISATTLYPDSQSPADGEHRGMSGPAGTSSKEHVAPPKRKTRVRTYAAVT